MSHALQFYIGGEWVAPVGDARLPVIDPSTEETFAEIAMGTPPMSTVQSPQRATRSRRFH